MKVKTRKERKERKERKGKERKRNIHSVSTNQRKADVTMVPSDKMAKVITTDAERWSPHNAMNVQLTRI